MCAKSLTTFTKLIVNAVVNIHTKRNEFPYGFTVDDVIRYSGTTMDSRPVIDRLNALCTLGRLFKKTDEA